ncbi:unnamed protein product [Brassicogethes aeneus]|uniref:Protein CNPPD1 n=1 Tax=Brassicogethes aeneus TaxID=1431903 RepID=A0A9P0B3X4_BRAAE|nr:unnamed protein product [Brassicogethes aeneus]
MSKISKGSSGKSFKSVGDHQKYLSRIKKTLYYGKLPKTDALSLPVTELAAELFSEAQKGKSLKRLDCYDASKISRNACVSPCSLVLAMLYLERLKKCNPEYLARTAPSDLFLVSLMISSKFLFDDGESDEVFMDEWAASGGMTVKELISLERDFLQAIEWEVYVGELKFWKKLNEIEYALAERQGKSRGFLTYTELEILSRTLDLHNLLQCLVALSVILMATYAAGILTLIGSVFLTSQIPGTTLYAGRKMIEMPNVGSDYVYGENKTDTCKFLKMDAVDVFKTGILLASISANESNSQAVTWDWWSIPAMNWLATTSDYVEKFELPLKNPFFFETYDLELDRYRIEDRLDKAVKTRIQDQMETSWHAEWTDTIKYGLFYHKLAPNLLYNVKS